MKTPEDGREIYLAQKSESKERIGEIEKAE
jgi:hypothetical protein